MAVAVFPILIFFLVLAVGVFLVSAITGRPRKASLSEPRCARCNYDLRGFAGPAPVRCSECGADLTERGAVLWGNYERKPVWVWLAVWGAGTALLIFLASFMLFASSHRTVVFAGTRVPFPGTGAPFPGTPAFSARSNSLVLASLKTSTATPWDWQELEKRQTAGKLSDAEIAAAIDTLITHLQNQPTVEPLTMSWSDRFVTDADAAGKISDEQYLRLARAFYKTCRVIIPRQSKANSNLLITIQEGPWKLPGSELVFALQRAAISGSPLKLVSTEPMNNATPDADYLSAKQPWSINARAEMNVPPGQHSLTFTVDVAVLRQNIVPNIAGDKPGQVVHWPTPRATWSDSITVPLTVDPTH